jgi:TetR/AcrR family transcriptional regulator, cholesterol catabolism regulator
MTTWPDEFGLNDIGVEYHERALPEDQLTTDRQRDRRARILDAAVEAAGAGGYDRVHVHDVAVLAQVSVATLYHYFPSKVHLLVWALLRELTRFGHYLSEELCEITDPYARLHDVVRRLIDAMEESEPVTEALAHAYVASNVVASAEAEMVRVQTIEMFVHLMSNTMPPDRHRHTAELLTDVWTSEVLALVQGRRTYAQMRRRLGRVIDLIARARQGSASSRLTQ